MVLIKSLGLILLLVHCSYGAANESVDPGHPRLCYSCEGINCQRTATTNVTSFCGDLLDICVTIFDGYTVTAKGCLADLSEAHRSKCEQRNNPECYKCFGQLCNNKGRADFKCVVCNSKDQSKCIDDTSSMTAVQCPIPTAINSYCYVRDAGINDISRGCSIDLQHQLDCLNDKFCALCLSQDGIACNSFELNGPKSGASRLLFTFSFSAFSLLLIVNLFK